MHKLIHEIAAALLTQRAMQVESFVVGHSEHLECVTIELNTYDLDVVVRCASCSTADVIRYSMADVIRV